MRFLIPALGLAAMTACAPQLPDSGAGVGFGDYNSYLRARTAQATAPEPLVPRHVTDLAATNRGSAPPDDARSIGARAVAAVRPQAAAPSQTPTQTAAAPQPTQSAPQQTAAGAPIPAGAATIYRDEVLDMDTARATRDAEQEAFERRRAEFRMAEPTALPDRPDDAPNIVAYALRTSHAVGQQQHRRSRLTLQNHAQNCNGFASADLAQEEFLRRGGPERDPLNLDPNGDGFACNWSPEPFRAAARAAN